MAVKKYESESKNFADKIKQSGYELYSDNFFFNRGGEKKTPKDSPLCGETVLHFSLKRINFTMKFDTVSRFTAPDESFMALPEAYNRCS